MSTIDEVVAAVERGRLVVIPTDTVYGLACAPDDEDAVRALSSLKRRPHDQPIALLAAGVDRLLELVPELAGRRLLTGALTLVLPNPAMRLPWLTGSSPATIGVRLPQVDDPVASLLARIGVVAATSANLHGGRDPARILDVPAEVLDAVAAVFDVGELPGTPSTVIDLTQDLPRILREGAVPAAEALALVSEQNG